MKKTIRTMALFTMLLPLPVGCMKENTNIPTTQVATTVVNYSAGVNCGQVVLNDNTVWDEFMNRMMALARQGYNVIIYNGNGVDSNPSKEKVVFTTNSEEEAKQWAIDMFLQGYIVQLIYNDETGTWTCVATK